MSFDKFNLPKPIAQALRELRYEKPTLIQEKAIPLIMQGSDVVGQSETGSGKTAAFGLPVLGSIHERTSMLVLTPTRELCVQVQQSLARFAWHLPLQIAAVYGGVGMNPQIKAVRTAHIVVATPGRLLDLMRRGAINLRNVKFLVLDEADRMLDMGFIDDVERIIGQTPASRQTLLFSATIPVSVRHIVQKYLRSPVYVKTITHVDKSKLREFYYEVSQEDRFSLLAHLLKTNTAGTALVFCATRRMVDKVTKNLRKEGIDAIAIHGGLSQHQRTRAIEALHKQEVSALIATDIAARGLHIQDIKYIYNYNLPTVAEDYTHRIGRTARAGAEGDAITLLTASDQAEFRAIQRIGHNPTKLILPTFARIASPPAQQQRFGHRPSNKNFRPRTEYGARPEHKPFHHPQGAHKSFKPRTEGGARPEHKPFQHEQGTYQDRNKFKKFRRKRWR